MDIGCFKMGIAPMSLSSLLCVIIDNLILLWTLLFGYEVIRAHRACLLRQPWLVLDRLLIEYLALISLNKSNSSSETSGVTLLSIISNRLA